MKLKRLISLFAALAMLAAFVPTLALAAGGTYTLSDITCPAGTSGVGAYATLLSPVTANVTIEFDYTPYGVQNNWIYISNGQSLWGAGAIGFGTDDDTTGHFKTQSSGTYLGYVTANTTYHITVETTVSNHTYTITMDDGNGTVWKNTDSYRTASDSLDTIVVSTNGASSSFALTNITVYDPNIEFEEYTVKYVDTEGNTVSADGTYTTVYDNTIGYNDEVICPYVDIPYFEGYIFTSKSVDTDNYIITLTYTATSVVDETSGMTNFFSNVSNNAPFISLNMLGAHDAFTAGMYGNYRMDAAGTAQGDSGSTYATAMSGSYASTVRNMSRAQDKTALELLEAGVRYFDIRLSRSTSTASASSWFWSGTAPHTNGVFYTTHGILSDEFRPIAYTLAQWLKEHPGEILVLDFQEVWDNTSSGNNGNSTATTWADFYAIVKEAGIADFVNYDYNTDISTVTYGGLTNGGTQAGAILFGRAVGYTQGKFYLRGDTSGAFNGTLYSNYSHSSVSIGSSFSEDYIDAQVSYLSEKSGDHAISSMARVMQAQSEGSNLLSQASTDNDTLYEILIGNTHTDWLTALPIVMINGAGDGTYAKELTAILKAANEPASLTANYTDTAGNALFTLSSGANIGTLYIAAKDSVVNNGSDTYLTTIVYAANTSDGEILPIPAIYDAESGAWTSEITIPVTTGTALENTSSVFTVQNGALYTGNLTDDGTYTGKKDFGAFNWSAKYSHDRIGVAVFDNSLQNTNAASYSLDATLARSNNNNESAYSVQLYAITYDEYRSMSLADIAQKFTDDNLIADFTPFGTVGAAVSIDLDADVIAKTVSDDANGRIVILGNSNNGLYALAGSGMSISYEGSAADGIEVIQTSSALSSDSFTAEFTIKNNDSTSLSANAYLAVYDENSDLKGAGIVTVAVDPSSEKNVTFTIDGTFSSSDTAKFFLWNGDLNPLADIISVTIE